MKCCEYIYQKRNYQLLKKDAAVFSEIVNFNLPISYLIFKVNRLVVLFSASFYAACVPVCVCVLILATELHYLLMQFQS